jgi:uroporphyrinogen decarboxylase
LVDRPPVALWRHFPGDDQSPEALAAAHLAFQELYDFDLLKVTPASSYSVLDWGVEDAWEGNTEGTRRYTKHVIETPSDWEGLRALEAHSPSFDAHIACLRLIRQGVGVDTPVLLTVFNALAQAKHLAGHTTLMLHLRKFPDAVAAGLRTITETTRGFIQAASHAGIDGIFFAVQHAQADLLSPDEFKHWSRALDLEILHSASDLWCNILHLHGENVYFDEVADYPVHIINWHDRETPPTLREAREKYHGVLCGGLARDTLVFQTADQVSREAMDAIAQAGSRRLLLSTGCVIPIITPHGNIVAARGAAAG